MKKKSKISKQKKKLTLAQSIAQEARQRYKTLEQQLEYVRWLRDVNCRRNFKAQLACATAIDILKGFYA